MDDVEEKHCQSCQEWQKNKEHCAKAPVKVTTRDK
jgi:hypothetical protein